MSITIDLLRHGQIDGPKALYGHTDTQLSVQGKAAMLAQINRLAIDGTVFSSPLLRCLCVAEQVSTTPVIISALAEMHFGDWDGIAFDRLQHCWPELEQFWQDPSQYTPPNGESLAAFYQRVQQAWQQVIAQAQSGQNLVICHGGVIRALLAHLLGGDIRKGAWFTSLKIDYASLTRITMSGQQKPFFTIDYINKGPVHD